MELRYESVLKKIYERSEELGSTHVTEVYTGVEGDERREICKWLAQQGYIRNVEMQGREIITCDIEISAIEYFVSAQGNCDNN